MHLDEKSGMLVGDIEKIPEGTSDSIIKQVIWGKSELAPKKSYDGSDEAYEDKLDRENNPFNK